MSATIDKSRVHVKAHPSAAGFCLVSGYCVWCDRLMTFRAYGAFELLTRRYRGVNLVCYRCKGL